MRLKKLEIHGFKSFADRTEIVFNEGITGIVGPNGSGKSNIGDAVRWVLGEQSAKALRGAKMEDVIFNGTAKRKQASYCEVNLVFDNADGALKSNFSEVMVTRRVYRNGDSDFFLNKTACRLKDILDLFRDTGIGREGYSLIGQGRIDEILSAKSENRRQVFEEAAGVMTYRVRKEDAERKLARTRDNLSRVNDILEELSSRVEPLEKQAAAAKEYLALAQRLKDLEINIFLIRHDKVKDRMAALDKTLEGLRDILLNHEARLNENAAQREALEDALSKLEAELADARRTHLDANEELHAAQSEKERAAHQIESIEEHLARLSDAIRENREKQKELDGLFARGDEDAQKSSQALQSAKDELDREEARLDQALEKAREQEEKLDRHKAEILEAMNRLSDFKSQQARQQAMCAQMKARLGEVESSIREGGEKQQEAAIALRSAEKQAAQADENLAKLKDDAVQTEASLRALTLETQETAERAQALNGKYQGDLSRLRLMEEMSREMEGYSQSVRRALSFAKDDPAVCGVVARLMQVPKELETAVDMVLGGALQNIVTRDEETAKRVIDHLRVNKLGRATFLPMTTVKSKVLSSEERRVLSMPGCLGVASEMISFAPEYRGVMENLLGRTVIAEDLDSGIPIMRAGRHAFRLVTLAGDVMHSGGSMTGGTAQKSAVSLLGREREIKELKGTLEAEKTELASLRDKLARMQSRREEGKRLRNESMERVHQEEIAVAREQERVFNAKAELSAAAQQLERVRQARDQLTESILEIEQDLAQAQARAENETVDQEAMDQKTQALQKALQECRESADAQRDRVTKMRLDYTRLSYTLDTLRRDRQRRDQEAAQLEKRFNEMRQDEARRKDQMEDAKRALADREEICRQKEENVRARLAAVDRMEERRQEMAKAQRESVKQSEEIHRAYDEDSLRLHRAELGRDRAENELKVMTDHIFNTYDMTYAMAEEFRAEGKFDLSGGEKEAAGLRVRIREMGHVNVGAIEEYAQTKERFDDLTAQQQDLTKAESDLQALIARLLSRWKSSSFPNLKSWARILRKRLPGCLAAGLPSSSSPTRTTPSTAASKSSPSPRERNCSF